MNYLCAYQAFVEKTPAPPVTAYLTALLDQSVCGIYSKW